MDAQPDKTKTIPNAAEERRILEKNINQLPFDCHSQRVDYV
jgi:hypothetical protein